jgi:hypothetical protein
MSRMLSPTTIAASIGAPSFFGRCKKQIRIRLGVFNLIAGDDRRLLRIDAERRQIEAGGLHPPAGCNRPRDARVRQKRQQLARAWQRSDVAGVVPVGSQVPLAQPFDTFDVDVEPGFSQQLIGKQAAAHADLAMDAPDRELDALGVECLLPRQHVLIDAVDQRSVEIEEKDRFDAHFRSNVHDWAKVQKRLPDKSFTALTTSLPGPLVTPSTVSHSESEQGMRCGIH